MMMDDLQTILFEEADIQRIVSELGKKISKDYQGKKLFIVGILKGCFIFIADLVRKLDIPCEIDFMAVSSYGNRTKTSGVVRILMDLKKPVEGLDVLIVEDILDSGMTLSYILESLKSRNPSSVRICTLLDKPARRTGKVTADYIGAAIDDLFVVGYGLDYDEKYRNLPYIGVLKEDRYRPQRKNEDYAG